MNVKELNEMKRIMNFIAHGVCPHLDGEICHDCHNDPSQLSYPMGDMADLTHATQVAIFNWCGCEDGERQYGDCPTGDN